MLFHNACACVYTLQGPAPNKLHVVECCAFLLPKICTQTPEKVPGRESNHLVPDMHCLCPTRGPMYQQAVAPGNQFRQCNNSLGNVQEDHIHTFLNRYR